MSGFTMADLLPHHLRSLQAEVADLRASSRRGRYAPSPTGRLHLGNLRTALLSWLITRLQGGEWLLRIDDLDTPRVRSGAVLSALEDLRWLGLDWNGPVLLQSRRRGLYNAVLSHLRRCGLVYACRCSRRQLGGVSVYPGTCRELGLAWGWKDHRLPAWRLRVQDQTGGSCGDVVVRRADGFIAYHLATAVDELCFGITEVVRGADLQPVKEAQVAVMAALGCAAPRYRHVPLLCDASGHKLAKREGSEGLAPWQERGARPEQVVGYLAAQLQLVPAGSVISASELVAEMGHQRRNLSGLLEP